MVIRYMGTKRRMADHVRDVIADLNPDGRVVDLFSGMGSVAESLKDTRSIVTNDALSFTAAISRARFTGADRTTDPRAVLERLYPLYRARRGCLRLEHAERLNDEKSALGGTSHALIDYMDTAEHVGNSPALRRKAIALGKEIGSERYQLATLYFASGYLSLSQAIEVDAIRYAIDNDEEAADADWLVSSWLVGLSVLINAPGHTAQFLRPNSPTSHQRIVRTWRRSVWDEFASALRSLKQVGTTEWRSGNSVLVSDALDLISGRELSDIGAVYSDPPYTKDQYSRYYHVYETLYRYDYPDSNGAGRNRSDRFSTGFCLKTAVIASFRDLCRNVARMGVPLVISYPSAGLLADAGGSLRDIAESYFTGVQIYSFDFDHSTMGASKGKHKQAVTENLYVCTS